MKYDKTKKADVPYIPTVDVVNPKPSDSETIVKWLKKFNAEIKKCRKK